MIILIHTHTYASNSFRFFIDEKRTEMTDSRCNLRHPSSSSLSNTSTINVQHIETAEEEVEKRRRKNEDATQKRKEYVSV